MTFLELQTDLCEEIEKILKDVQTKKPGMDKAVGVTAYRQQLPKVVEDDEDETQFFPYAIVRASEGTTQDDFEPWIVTVDLIFGIYDNDPKNAGHEHVSIMIQRVIDRFEAEPLLNRKFRAQPDPQWVLQDEDSFPFYFGAIRMKFAVPKIGRRTPDYV